MAIKYFPVCEWEPLPLLKRYHMKRNPQLFVLSAVLSDIFYIKTFFALLEISMSVCQAVFGTDAVARTQDIHDRK